MSFQSSPTLNCRTMSFRILFTCALAATLCSTHPWPLLGPVFAIPRNLSMDLKIASSAKLLSQTLTTALQQGQTPFGNFKPNLTSVSVLAVSGNERASFFEFHHTSRLLEDEGASEVDSDTVYRIGSVSKLFTVYALLLNGAREHWDCPVTEFIPELREAAEHFDGDDVTEVRWEDVKIGALASQMSGIGRDYNAADLASQAFPAVQLGLPELAPADVPTCAGNASLPPCSRTEYFQGLVRRPPVFSPRSTPIYSNTAYRILGYVLEAVTGLPFDEAMSHAVLRPLTMDRTSVLKPQKDSWGVIPKGFGDAWARNMGDEGPAGGMYSSAADLAKLANAILNSAQLSPVQTRAWMKPVAHTSSLFASVGAPWEITRTKSNITSGRTVDLYTKSGGVAGYTSLMILVPDYDVAFIIMAAGPDGFAINVMAEIITRTFLPLLEDLSRDQAETRFGGRYSSGTQINSSIALGVDDGPGLVIKSWISNGSNLLVSAQDYADATNGGDLKSIRLYPTNLLSMSSRDKGTKIAYRAVFEMETHEDDGQGSIFDTDSNSWSSVDKLVYGNIAIDDFVFHLDGEGGDVAVEPRALRIVLQRERSTDIL